MQASSTENNDLSRQETPLPTAPSDVETKPIKPRKKYEWTEKRKEAFDKMRKGLEEKVLITKQLKEHKRKSEKEAIKAKVKEIMESKKGKIEEESSDSAMESSSEEEQPRARKKSHREKKEVVAAPPKINLKKKPREIPTHVPSDSEFSSSEEEEEEEQPRQKDKNHYSASNHHNYQRDKVERGKAIKVAQFINPLDRFILL